MKLSNKSFLLNIFILLLFLFLAFTSSYSQECDSVSIYKFKWYSIARFNCVDSLVFKGKRQNNYLAYFESGNSVKVTIKKVKSKSGKMKFYKCIEKRRRMEYAYTDIVTFEDKNRVVMCYKCSQLK